MTEGQRIVDTAYQTGADVAREIDAAIERARVRGAEQMREACAKIAESSRPPLVGIDVPSMVANGTLDALARALRSLPVPPAPPSDPAPASEAPPQVSRAPRPIPQLATMADLASLSERMAALEAWRDTYVSAMGQRVEALEARGKVDAATTEKPMLTEWRTSGVEHFRVPVGVEQSFLNSATVVCPCGPAFNWYAYRDQTDMQPAERGGGPDLESAKRAADEAACQWYRLPEDAAPRTPAPDPRDEARAELAEARSDLERSARLAIQLSHHHDDARMRATVAEQERDAALNRAATAERERGEAVAYWTAVMERARAAVGNGTDDEMWRPGETAVDALIRRCDEALALAAKVRDEAWEGR